jgi:hypothetical protein
MKIRLGSATAIVAVTMALLMVFVLPAGAAAASAPDLTPGPSYTLWAYGVVRTVDFSGSSSDRYEYQGSATYGYSVILNQTNLSSSTFELSANRTMGALLSVEYCTPSCKNPTATATIAHHAWEAVDAWANFTTLGNVSEDGQNVSAIALLNSHSTLAASLTDSAQGPLRSSYVSANVSAAAAVDFGSPLGLLPTNLTAPQSWSSASTFSASGNYTINYAYRYSGPRGSTSIGPATLSGEVSRTGNVTVSGSSTGASKTVELGGSHYLNVSLDVAGPFSVREGFILVPDQGDLFSTASVAPISSNETGATSVQMTSLYVGMNQGGHLGIDGSEWVYSASALNPSVTAVAPAAGGVTELAAGSDNVGSTPVQGVPISVDQAQGYQGCLLNGAACPSSGTRALVPYLTLGVIALVVVSVVAVVALGERRRIPPPAYPNAKLYPPGGPPPAKSLPSGAPSVARRAPPPAEDDPLSNLW